MSDHDHILIARVGWAERYQGEDNLAKTNGEDYECFNFRTAPDGRCYGWIPGWPPALPVPRTWLVVFIAQQTASGPWYAVGWYENAILETGNQPGITETSTGKPIPYSVHTEAKNAHLIPSGRRHLFPIPDVGLGLQRRPYFFARDTDEPAFSESWYEPWRMDLAHFAETIASGQVPSKPSSKGVVATRPGVYVERRLAADPGDVGC